MKVFSVRICGVDGEFKIQGFTKILSNITNDLLLCSSSKAGYRYRVYKSFFFLKLPYEITYIKIVNTKILSLCREAVCLIYNKTNYVSGKKQSFNCCGPKGFRRDIQNRSISICHTVDGIFPLDRI